MEPPAGEQSVQDDGSEQAEEARMLHALRLRGKVPASREASGSGESESEATEWEVAGERLVAAGFAVRRGDMLVLTAAGRAEADTRFCLVGGPGHEYVQAAYERFGPLNRTLLSICTDWQVRAGGVPNDHRDSVYDWGVIDRLVTLDQQIGPVVRTLGKHVDRFVRYRERMREARRRAADGDSDWLLSPRIDSYHTVWMQLHEDLLLGLGIERGNESVDGPGDGSADG